MNAAAGFSVIGVSILCLTSFARADEPDECRAVRDGSRVELRSPFFSFHLDTRAGLRAEAWENRLSGHKISLGNGPELEVDLGEPGGSLQTPAWRVIGLPTGDDNRGPEGEAVFQLSSDTCDLSALVTYRWNPREPVLRKFVRITNKAQQEVRLLNVRLGTYHTQATVAEREQGFPVYLDREFFMSLAHPAGWASGKDGEVSLRHYPGTKLGAGVACDCMEAVYGVGPAGAARQTFVAHVRGRMRRVVRGHDRPYAIFDNFGSWPSGNFANTEDYMLHSLGLLAEGQKATGCRFDLCNIHFWVDSAGDMKRWDPARFPGGIARIKPILDSLGTAPGLWISSATTWADSWSLGISPITRPSVSQDPGWYCRASEPIKSMFRDAFIYHVRDEGVRLLKFDNFHALCDNPAHDHLPGLYSTEAIENSTIRFFDDLDNECPDVFLILYWGYRSPWWLVHADTLFDSGIGIEAASPSSQPALHARDSVTQKLDQAQSFAGDIPVLGKDSLGIWLSDWGWNSSIGKERWQEGFVMDICRGNMLAQIWADHDWLSPPERQQLADFIALLRAQPRCFGNPRPILGDPWKDEPYGYCCTDGQRAFLALNNCTWQDRTIPLTLDSTWGLPDALAWDVYRWYPDPARLVGDTEHAGKKVSILMRPFEVVLLEVVAAGRPPTLDRPFPTCPLPTVFAEASRDIEVSVRPVVQKADPAIWTVLAPTSAVSKAGAVLTIHADGSILAGGSTPVHDLYTVTAETGLTGITGVRLEVLTDPSLPSQGPGRAFNGNFAISEFAVIAGSRDGRESQTALPLVNPAASFSQASFGGWPIEAVLDKQTVTAWSIDPHEGEPQTAVFETQAAAGFAGGTTLTFVLEQNGPDQHTLGRFRLSVTTAKPPIPRPEAAHARLLALRAQAPVTERGGTLVVTAELKRGAEAIPFPDIGSLFVADAKLGGRSLECRPVLGTATYPSSWQAWRIAVGPSTAPQEVELSVGASVRSNVEILFTGHFCPGSAGP